MNRATPSDVPSGPVAADVAAAVSRPRRWKLRLLAVSLPLVLVVLLELVFRVAGLFPDNSSRLNPVGFEAGTRFFPQWDQELAAAKPAGTRRIFTLGGSCTYGFRVDRPFGELLGASLVEVGGPVEVINGGYPAYGSHRVLAIARRAAEFSPDWFVVYMGHNEFLEDVFYDPEGMVVRMEQAGEFARGLRVINGVRAMLGEATTTVHSQLPSEFFGNENYPLIKSPEMIPPRMALLRQHVLGIVEAGERAGAKVIIVPAVPNLLAPPGDSVHGPGVDDGSARFGQLARAANRHFEARDWEALGETATEMISLDDHFAMAHFWHGLSLLGQGKVEEGRQALVEANRRDRRGTRSNPDVIETISRAAADAGAVLLSVEELFNRELQAEFQRMVDGGSRELFVDHCHPTQKGHALIAQALATQLRQLGSELE